MVEEDGGSARPRKRNAGFRIVKDGDEPILDSLRRLEEALDVVTALQHESIAEMRRSHTLLKRIFAVLLLLLICALGLLILR